jgi:uncharacterized protein with FMN-binding domain
LRRAIVTIGGTVAGLAALLSFKTHPVGAAASTTPQALSAGASASAMPTVPEAGRQGGIVAGHGSATAKPGGTAKPPATAKPAVTPKSGGGSGQASAPRTVTGAVASTQYGPMQVAVTLSGTRITKVTVLQQTDVGAQSGQIDAMAIPTLNSEALTAQSAHIDAVSGASYTSAGYKQSLQSALDKAGI